MSPNGNTESYIFTFTNTNEGLNAYKKYKDEVVEKGGRIHNDFGPVVRGFTAAIPVSLIAEVNLLRSGSFAKNGINTFEPDRPVTINRPTPNNRGS